MVAVQRINALAVCLALVVGGLHPPEQVGALLSSGMVEVVEEGVRGQGEVDQIWEGVGMLLPPYPDPLPWAWKPNKGPLRVA